MRYSLVVSLLLVAGIALADWKTEEPKVEFLLNEVAGLDATFIRNGEEHPAKKAAEHLRMKLENAQDSWFAPSKDKWTAEMFIEKVASKSFLSGEPYKIRFKGGKEVKAGDWFRKELKEYKPKPKNKK